MNWSSVVVTLTLAAVTWSSPLLHRVICGKANSTKPSCNNCDCIEILIFNNKPYRKLEMSSNDVTGHKVNCDKQSHAVCCYCYALSLLCSGFTVFKIYFAFFLKLRNGRR